MATTDTPKRGRGRPPKFSEAMTPARRQARHKEKLLARLERAERALVAADKQLASVIAEIGAGGDGPARAAGIAGYAREIISEALNYRE